MSSEKDGRPRHPLAMAAAEDTRSKLVTFTNELWDRPIEEITPTAGERTPLSLERVIKELHDADINCGIQTFCWCGLRVWIGDNVNGIKASAAVTSGEPAWHADGSLALWLRDQARIHYPAAGL